MTKPIVGWAMPALRKRDSRYEYREFSPEQAKRAEKFGWEVVPPPKKKRNAK
jgi:hypothetical protein